jgi:hypothetical protein
MDSMDYSTFTNLGFIPAAGDIQPTHEEASRRIPPRRRKLSSLSGTALHTQFFAGNRKAPGDTNYQKRIMGLPFQEHPDRGLILDHFSPDRLIGERRNHAKSRGSIRC